MVNFIVVHQSYLVRKGISAVIEDMDKGKVLAEFSSQERLNNPALLSEVDYIIIDSQLQTDASIESKYLQLQLIKVFPDHQSIEASGRNSHEIDLQWDKETLERFFIDLREQKEPVLSSDKSASELSEREVDVLTCVALGMTNKEIADKLFISSHTVITHRKNITRKLGIKTVSGLTVYAYLNKFISLEDVNK